MSVRFGLLGLIAQKPRHGYELHAAFIALAGGEENWDIKPAQVYSTISRLKEAGLIVEDGVGQEGGPEKTIFSITQKGVGELREWLASPVEAERQKDRLFIKLMICIATGEQDPVKVIYNQRSNLYKELHRLNDRRARTDVKTELAHMMLLEQAAMHIEADLKWLEMLEGRLDEIKRQPLPEPGQKARGRPVKKPLDALPDRDEKR